MLNNNPLSNPYFRPLHISDDAPRNFHLFCGKFSIGKSTEYKALRKGCNIKRPNKDCVALKVMLPIYAGGYLTNYLMTDPWTKKC